MIGIVIAIFIIIFVFFLLSLDTNKTGYIGDKEQSKKQAKKDNNIHDSLLNCEKTYYTSGYTIWLEVRKGFEKFEMIGMYYRKLVFDDMGIFEGYAKSEYTNKYDPYAVAIYRNDNKLVGYIRKGNRRIHELIKNNGGLIPAHGYISYSPYLKGFSGEVGIKTNLFISAELKKLAKVAPIRPIQIAPHVTI